MRTFDFSSILILYSCVLHRGHDCARSLELDFPTTTNVQVNQVKSLAAFWFAPCGQTLLQHYAVWQRPCCCCHPSQIFSNLIHILQRWRADNTASRKRKHWGFVLHSSQPNCLAAFSHCKENAKFSTFGVKKIPQHFLVGRRRSGKKKKNPTPNNQRKKHFKMPEASAVSGPDCPISAFNFSLRNQVYMLPLFKLFTVSTGNTHEFL